VVRDRASDQADRVAPNRRCSMGDGPIRLNRAVSRGVLGDTRALAGAAIHRAMSEERPPERQEQQNRRGSRCNVKRVCHEVGEAKVTAGGMPRVGGGSTGNQN